MIKTIKGALNRLRREKNGPSTHAPYFTRKHAIVGQVGKYFLEEDGHG